MKVFDENYDHNNIAIKIHVPLLFLQNRQTKNQQKQFTQHQTALNQYLTYTIYIHDYKKYQLFLNHNVPFNIMSYICIQ